MRSKTEQRPCEWCGRPFLAESFRLTATCGAICREARARSRMQEYNRSYYLKNRGAGVKRPRLPREG